MASKYLMEDEEDDEAIGLIAYAKETLLRPFDIIFSKTAQRAYLTTFLIILTASVALSLATWAYILFYWSYIPRIGFERPIYFQFDNVFATSDTRYDTSANPHGSINLLPDIVSAQRYDVVVELSLPRTPDNRHAGNFMIEAIMYAAGSIVDPVKDTLAPGTAEEDNRLAFSRRPAILSYRSAIVDQLYKATELHWYLLGWRSEAEKLTVRMFEGVEFDRGWRNLPSTMTVQLQSTNRMQVYSAKAMFKARFRGLRWLMYNHRIISAVIFISGFWTTELVFAALAWAVLSHYMARPSQVAKAEELHEVAAGVKQEGDEEAVDSKLVLSDTERTFPSSSRQPPLRYESPQIKSEEDDDAVVLPEVSNRATEADDEDDDEEEMDFRDSGIGTSMESSAGRRDSVRRRRGRTEGDGQK